ncbi:MAG: hypothetical protein KKC75_05065 [Nanoarchaeota archaeon]|nr:hypothetical protein [Nanoarchaeota archaeon]MBU1004824.1 hypothetical protein [Nanoarchaeota archaeon]MBU1946762.1 hypothetical protein [Nanoarchaeota archaeon]
MNHFNLLEEINVAEMGAVLLLGFLATSIIKLAGEGGITGAVVGTVGNSIDLSLVDFLGGAVLFSVIMMVYVLLIKKINSNKKV